MSNIKTTDYVEGLVNNLEKNTETIQNGLSTLKTEVEEIKNNSGTNVDLSEYQKKSDNRLTTTDKNIVGAINEIKTSLSNLVIESGNLDIIDYTFGCTLKLDEVEPIYGNIVVNKTSISGNEGTSDTFTVKLDSQPNVNQTVRIYCADAYINVSSQSLVFNPSDYSTEKTITVDILENPSHDDWTADIKVLSNNVTSRTITVNATNITETPVSIESISLDKTTLSLNAGDTATLTPTITPTNATTRYAWKSSDASKARVENGVVTAISGGSVTITCYSIADESIKAECLVTVTEVSITSITLPETATVSRNRSITLTPTIVPEGLLTYSWRADNDNVTIENGTITGVTAGESVVTCYSTKDDSISDSTTITVTELAIESITIAETANVIVGKTLTLTPVITPSDATTTYSWRADNDNVTIENGTITGVTAGTSIITCYSDVDNSIKGECTLTIKDKVVKVIDNVAIKDDSLYYVFDMRDGSNEEKTSTIEDRVTHDSAVATFTIENPDKSIIDENLGFTGNSLRGRYTNIPGVSGPTKSKITVEGIGTNGYETTATYKNITASFGFNSIDIIKSTEQFYYQFVKRGTGYGIGLCNREDGLYWAKAANAGSADQTRICDALTGKNFVTFVWNGSTIDIYINAEKKTSVPYSGTHCNGAFFNTWALYNAESTSKEYFSELQLATLHTRILTDEEILQNYNAYIGGGN